MEMKLSLLPILRTLISLPIFENSTKRFPKNIFFGFYLFLVHLKHTNYRVHYD